MKFENVAANLAAYELLEVVANWNVTLSNTVIRRFVQVYHFKRTSGILQADLTSIAQTFDGFQSSQLAPLLNIRGVYQFVSVRPLDDPTVMEVENSDDAGTAGGITTDSYDSCSAVFIELDTGTRGKSFRGSKHFAPLSEADTLQDELTGTALTAWTAFAGILGTPYAITDGNGNEFSLCVLSKTLSQLSGPSIQFTGGVVESAKLQPVVGTMRRRKEINRVL